MRGFRNGQEEMVGFALIIILVIVILIVFLGFGLKNDQENIESFEADSFIQSILQFTTECSDNFESLSVQKLIFYCEKQETCSGGQDSCEILNTTLNGILNESWTIREGSLTKGYDLRIVSDEEETLKIQEGNITANSKGSSQEFFKEGKHVRIIFTAYT